MRAERHWISDTAGTGAILVLENETIYKVSRVDRITSMLWLPMDDVIVRPGDILGSFTIVNLDTRETVVAFYLGD